MRLLPAFALLLAACPVRGGNNDDDDDDATLFDDDDASGDDDDTGTPPPPETACEDGQDNDEDGLVDCADDDCAAVFRCTWPTSMSHSGSFDYDASTLAEFAGYSDCVTQFTSTLVEETVVANQCPTCDRTFTGPLSYGTDTCPMDGPRPATVSYGIVFTDTLNRPIYTMDTNGVWTMVGTGVSGVDGGPYNMSRNDPVEVDGIDGGDLTTNLSFTDL
jgi:hypothetical protein